MAAQAAVDAATAAPEPFMQAWHAVLEPLSIAHIQACHPGHAALRAYENIEKQVLNSILLSRKIVWRSRNEGMVVIISFEGVRIAKPSEQRQVVHMSRRHCGLDKNQGRPLPEEGGGAHGAAQLRDSGDNLSHFDIIQERRQEYHISVMVNAKTTTAVTKKDVNLEKLTGLAPDEFGPLTPQQEEDLLAAARVRTNNVLEAQMVKIPCPHGIEARDDVTQWRPYSRAYGQFVINGRSLKQHAILVPKTNVPTTQLKDANTLLRTSNFALEDGKYRSTSTIRMEMPWTTSVHPVVPNVTVALSYPRQTTVPLLLAFRLLHIDDIPTMMRTMWKDGVPVEHRAVAALVRVMLQQQADAAAKRNIVTREDLFSTLKLDITSATTREEDGIDSYNALQLFQRLCLSVTAEMFPQEGTLEVRHTMLAKAFQLGYMARVTVLTAAKLRPVDDPQSPAQLRQQYIDFRMAKALHDVFRKHTVPVLRRSIRQQAQQNGSSVMGNTLLAERHRPMTGVAFGVFERKERNAPMGATKSIQGMHHSPVDEGNVTLHLPITSKGASEIARSNKVGHTGDICLHHSRDGEDLGLVRARNLAARWRPGRRKSAVRAQVDTALYCMRVGMDGERHGLGPLTPPRNELDTTYADTGRSLDWFINTEFMHRGVQHLTSTRTPLVLVNNGIAGTLVPGLSAHTAVAHLVEARRVGIISRDTCVMEHELGVSIVCDSGACQRPLIRMDNFHKLEALGPPSGWVSVAMTLQAAIDLGAVEYVSTDEARGRRLHVARDLYDVRDHGRRVAQQGHPFTHMELHPFMLVFGCCLGIIPFVTMGASPRIILPGSMISHAAHTHAQRQTLRYGTHLMYPQEMLAQTLLERALPRSYLATQNLVIAVVAHKRLDDDAWIVCKESNERGLLWVTRRYTYRAVQSEHFLVVSPRQMRAFHKVELLKDADRSQLDETGVIRRGAKVGRNTVLIQRVRRCMDSADGGGLEGHLEDVSILHNRSPTADDDGQWTVDKVVHGCKENGGVFTVTVSATYPLQVNDKLANVYGQKASIAAFWPQIDMPWVAYGDNAGLTPDILMSPTAFMRMTAGFAWMAQTGAAVAAAGMPPVDGTPYVPFDADAVETMCRQAGLGNTCMVPMMDGRTGQLMGDIDGSGRGSLVFMGVVPMLRQFTHLPQDKINACGHEARLSQTTGQALKGRADLGSPMRFGELPHDAAACHGAAFISRDAVWRSNKGSFPVCGACGTINPSPPTDFVSMVDAKQPRCREALVKLLDDYRRCVHCHEVAVEHTQFPQIMNMINNVLGAENITMKLHIEPIPRQELQHAKDEAERELLADLGVHKQLPDDESDGDVDMGVGDVVALEGELGDDDVPDAAM